MSALNKQVGGSHYKTKAMQPVELWAALNLNAFQGAIVKYITRHKEKNGAADIDKAEHFFDLWAELRPEGLADDTFNSRVDDAMSRYCRGNELTFFEGDVLLAAVNPAHFFDIYRESLDKIRRENGYPVPDRG